MLKKKEILRIQKDIARENGSFPVIFSALGDFLRLRIFRVLMKHRDLCVTDIANIFGVSVPAASQQLRIMEMSGLVEREKMGKMVCYKIKKNNPRLNKLLKILKND